MSKKCTPLWREAHFQVKMYKTPQLRTTFGSCDVEKVHAVVARSTFRSQNVQTHLRFGPLLEVEMSKKCTPLWREAHFEVKMYKTHWQCSDHFWKFRSVEKVHAVVARSTFRSQNVQNTRRSDHFWKFRCPFASPLWREAQFQVKMYINYTTCTLPLHFTTLHYTTLHYTTTTSTTTTTLLHSTTLHTKLQYATQHYTTLHSTTLHYTTLHYTTLHYTALPSTTLTLHYSTLHYATLHYNYNYTTTQLHYTTLHYTKLHYITLHSTTLHSTTLHYTTLHYLPLHSTTLNYTTLHYITLHYITLDYTTPQIHYTDTLQIDRH